MNCKKKNKIFGIVAFILIAVAVFAYTKSPTSSTQNGDGYLEAAKLGGAYLTEHIDDKGKYVYEYNPVKNKTSKSYNILRHAGTTYSLLELYQVTGEEKLLTSAEKALDYLLDATEPCPNSKEAECIVEKNAVKLGGNGLAILAMAKHAEVTGTEKYIPHAQKLAEFITEVQSEEGEFTVHKMNMGDGSVADFTSMYYPGEALFALARLYEKDGNEKWILSAHKGAKWIIEIRDAGKSIRNLEHDHWLLYALNELHENNGDQLYVEHSKKIVDAILDAQHKDFKGEKEDWNGGYYNPPRSTPTATRTEGLCAAAQTFERAGESEYAEKAKEAAAHGIEFQLRTQMTSEKIKKLDADKKSLGGFHSSLTDYEIRIDYVQHNISAILGYLAI